MMPGRIPAAGALLVLVLGMAAACHKPAYVASRSNVEAQAKRACISYSDTQVWTAGREAFLVTVRCERTGIAAGSRGKVELRKEVLTYLCRAGERCTAIKGVGDWAARSVPLPGASATSVAAERSPDLEVSIRQHIDARTEAILACVDGQTTVVEIRIAPEGTAIELRGALAGTAAEACARAALGSLELPDMGGRTLTVRHPVLLK
jgi:hypothetical protein